MTTQTTTRTRKIHIDEDQFIPVFIPYIFSEQSTQLYTGNRGSGKSKFNCQKAVMFCLAKKYFRLIFCRKVQETIRESVFQMIKDVINEWGLTEEFKILESSMDFVHLRTGNMMISHGLDKPEKLKSIADPTHVLVEEMTEITFADYAFLQSVLRTSKAKTQFWGLFNPEFNFWGREYFFQDHEGSRIPLGEVESKQDGTLILKTSFEQNPYIDVEAYKNKLIELSAGDRNYLTVWVDGDWGIETVDDPFVLTFVPEKHVGVTVWQKQLETYLSFDFNVNPITCGVYQHLGNKIWCVESIKLVKSDIYRLCDHVITKYPQALFVVTGDATGRNTSALVQDGINYYTIIKSKLNLGDSQIRVHTVNPKIEENRVLVNSAFKMMDILIDKDNCKDLIFDLTYVAVDDVGKIDKGSRTNPKKRADHLDHFRYYLNTFHKQILKF
jgi:hypothetical protein